MTVLFTCIGDNGSCDRPIVPSNQNQYIIWGIGSLGETAFQHHTRAASKQVEQCHLLKFHGLCDFEISDLGITYTLKEVL